MTEETGFHDSHGIPIYVGDLIRVKHYRHMRNRRQMWMYFRVATINGRFVIQNWNNLNPNEWQTSLACSEVSLWGEVIAEDGIHRNNRNEIMTFNERPRLKPVPQQPQAGAEGGVMGKSAEVGPIYGVELLRELPLDGGMIQAMPSRKDLESARIRSERAVAGFEVLTEHYRRALNKLATIPDWHDKPTCAGRWLDSVGCEAEWSEDDVYEFEDVDAGSDEYFGPYYGPIPDPPKEQPK